MTIEGGIAIVLASLFVNIGVIVPFVGAVFMVGRLIGWRRERRGWLLLIAAQLDVRAAAEPEGVGTAPKNISCDLARSKVSNPDPNESTSGSTGSLLIFRSPPSNRLRGEGPDQMLAKR
jgi:hypothetical protein